MLDDRPGVDGVLDDPSGRSQVDRARLKAVVNLTIDVATFCLALSILAGVWRGRHETILVLWSFAVCLVPALASLLWVSRHAAGAPWNRIRAIVAGSALRMFATPVLAIIVWCVILSEQRASFWLWLIVAYALTLAAEVRHVLRVLRYDQPSPRATSPNSSGSVE